MTTSGSDALAPPLHDVTYAVRVGGPEGSLKPALHPAMASKAREPIDQTRALRTGLVEVRANSW
jgi:hypothetical protein